MANHPNRSRSFPNIEKHPRYSGSYIGYGHGNVYRIKRNDWGGWRCYIISNAQDVPEDSLLATRHTLAEISAWLADGADWHEPADPLVQAHEADKAAYDRGFYGNQGDK